MNKKCTATTLVAVQSTHHKANSHYRGTSIQNTITAYRAVVTCIQYDVSPWVDSDAVAPYRPTHDDDVMMHCRTILTHFSQRYPRMPEGIDCNAWPLQTRPIVAMDGMCLPLSLLPHLPLAMPLIAHVLSADPAPTDAAKDEVLV